MKRFKEPVSNISFLTRVLVIGSREKQEEKEKEKKEEETLK